MRCTEFSSGSVEPLSREMLGYEPLVETDGLATRHVLRAHTMSPAIDLRMRGPESGNSGRRLGLVEPVELTTIAIGTRVAVVDLHADRPGHGGEGVSAGSVAS